MLDIFTRKWVLSVFMGIACGLVPVAMGGSITLPLPIYVETFDTVAEGNLPAGWTQTNYTDLPEAFFDLHNLASASYAKWVVVDRSRFASNFVGYTSHTPVNYSQVLTANPANLVNGQIVTNLASGRFAFSTSGYREGNQVMYLFTPDFDLTGKTNVHLSFHSIWEQNQDSMGAVEYSVDGGTNWLPVVYMLDSADVLTTAGNVDAVKTFTNRYSDVATYTDPVTHTTKGGFYGAFIASPITQALAPYISARVNDDEVESKRVELFRLTAADNKSKVRFRFAHAGTDSWYFGLDQFGLYSINPGSTPVIASAPANMKVSAGSSATFNVAVSGQGPLTYQWQFNGTNINGATNASLTVSSAGPDKQGIYTVVVSNGSGSIQSGGAVLTLFQPVITGQWDFDYGDLRATVGADLDFVGDTAGITTFPSLEISGKTANVMSFGSNSVNQGFYMRHGAKPNGGGQFVNQYSLIMDVMYPAPSSDQWRALFQTDPFNHPTNDADFLVGNHATLPDPNGIGAGTEFNGTLAPGIWHRIAFTVDLMAPVSQRLTKYVNGVKVGTQSLSEGADGRYALGPTAQLFTAGTSGNTRAGFVNSIQFVNGWLPEQTIAVLGSPTAGGIPSGNAALRITDVSVTNGALVLSWTGQNGPFQVQRTASLVNPTWQDVGLGSTNRTLSIVLNGSGGFYRVRQALPPMMVGPTMDGEHVLPTAQMIRSAGRIAQFGGRPVDLALSPDGRTAYVKNMTGLLVIDVGPWNLLQQLAYPASGASMHGIAVSTNGTRVYVTGAGNELYEAAVSTNGTVAWLRTITLSGNSNPTGIALKKDGSKAYVCLGRKNTLGIVDLQSGTLVQQINVGVAPWDVVLSPDETKAYVSDWGGRFPTGADLKADSAGTQVVVDARGIGASGVVSIVNLAQNLETAQVPTGLHPSDMEISPDGQTLFVANANSDTVTIINTANGTVKETVLVRPDPTFPYGSAANGLALSRDGQCLFVASAGNNAIGVVELPSAQHANSIVQGFIPTDWYPGAVVSDTNHLYVINVKGLGSRNGPPNSDWDAGKFLGTAAKIPIPSSEALSKLTAQVLESGRIAEIRKAHQPALSGQAPVPVPKRVGEPSVFQHVVYVIKENKTYDQIFGDFPQANGNSNLCVFPRQVTPNHHALAEQFVLLDNFYCNGVNSADGHSWVTEGNVTDHLEKSFGGFNRSYTFGDDALTYSSSGFIWNNVLEHGLTFRNYGEMDYASPSPNATWLQIYADFTNNTRQIRYTQNIGVAPLRQYSSTNVPGWNLGIPDIVRADGFIRELHAAESNGTWEAFHILYLPNDHTAGSSPGFPTPRAQVADNDLALGRAIAAITQSRFWSNTCIFVIEDDPQSGYDHVDGHRSICLVISPYTKRGAVISHFYNQTGVIHTMEQILGLPPMNQLDAMAPLMTDCFTNVPNYQPYVALANNIALNEMNPGTTSQLSRKERYWAKKSLKLDFSKPDRIKDDSLNRIVWQSVRGDAKYPKQYAGAHGKGLKALHLVLDKSAKDDDDDD